MKKLKLTGKLSLNKETVARLSDNQMEKVNGGFKNPLSWGMDCTIVQCVTFEVTRGMFCNPN